MFHRMRSLFNVCLIRCSLHCWFWFQLNGKIDFNTILRIWPSTLTRQYINKCDIILATKRQNRIQRKIKNKTDNKKKIENSHELKCQIHARTHYLHRIHTHTHTCIFPLWHPLYRWIYWYCLLATLEIVSMFHCFASIWSLQWVSLNYLSVHVPANHLSPMCLPASHRLKLICEKIVIYACKRWIFIECFYYHLVGSSWKSRDIGSIRCSWTKNARKFHSHPKRRSSLFVAVQYVRLNWVERIVLKWML